MIKMRAPNRLKKRRMSDRDMELLDKLNAYVDGQIQEPAVMLASVWEDQATVISYKELRECLLSGTISEQYFQDWQKDYSKVVEDMLKPLWISAMASAANDMDIFSGKAFTLNMQSPLVLSWINERGAEFVTNCVDEQRRAMRHIIGMGVVDNHSAGDIAKLVRPCIGLTERQTSANIKYYTSVYDRLIKDNPNMKISTAKKKAREAAYKYAGKQHRYRADTIAINEVVTAYNRGGYLAILQAQRQGLMGEVVKKWITAEDEGVCERCIELNGTIVGMKDEFSISRLYPGQHLVPPLHPRCRCGVAYEEVSAPDVFAPIEEEEYMRNPVPRGYVDERTLGPFISIAALDKFKQYAELKGFQVGVDGVPYGGFDTYRGEEQVLYELVDMLEDNMQSDLVKSANISKVILKYDNVLGYEYAEDKSNNAVIDIHAMAMTKANTITLNKFMLDDSNHFRKTYDSYVQEGFSVKGTDYRYVLVHEIGHIVARKNRRLYPKILREIEAVAAESGEDTTIFIRDNISKYAALIKNNTYNELIPEINCLLQARK